jgi:hypothetical protein
MKSLAFLIFIFLVVPGSGQLAWDGLPFSTRLEFATLVIFVVALLSPEIRQKVRDWLQNKVWRLAVRPVLVLLAVVKLLTFTWYPFSDGFDACYRSLYVPIENPDACERSYEGPFLRRSDLSLTNTSRIDGTVDFGIQMHDWSLPFMNDYPRLGALWLSRLPFTVTYGAIVSNNTSIQQFLPIYSNGELEATLAGGRIEQSDIPLVDRYQFSRLQFLQVPTAPSELRVEYKFTDDDSSVLPDAQPPIRGAYAQLKIGQPLSQKAILKFADVRVRGWTIDVGSNKTPDAVIAVNSANNEIGRTETQARPDVAAFWGRPSLTMNGFNFAIPASELTQGDATIKAVYGTSRVTIGVVTGGKSLISTLPSAKITEVNGIKTQIETWFDADRNKFPPLAPVGRFDPGRLFLLLTLLVDGVSAMLFVGLIALLVLRLRWWLPIGLATGAVAYVLFSFSWASAPDIFGSRLFLPIATLVAAFVILRRRWKRAPAITFFPIALALAHVFVFDMLERFFSGRGERWWGRLQFYWRDSDWYATRGYARQIFVSGSAHGGESTFWFQAGPRYLSFVQQSLLGENDVLIGLLATALGFFALIYLIMQFVQHHDDLPALVVSGVLLAVGLLFMTEESIAGFGFIGSSEHPTWAVLFAVTGFFISRQHESRTWLLVTLSLALGYCVQLRPNQIGGIVAIFLALLLYVERTDRTVALGNIARMTTAFGVVVSLSLLHNLYYGENFTLFTANGGINVAFEWTKILSTGDFSAVWQQLRTMLYWNSANNWPWALAFWGSQILWLSIFLLRTRRGQLLHAKSLFLVIPFGYALPMLKYQMGSYYPRHLVAINLAFMCAALMAWPRVDESGDPAAATPPKNTEQDKANNLALQPTESLA